METALEATRTRAQPRRARERLGRGCSSVFGFHCLMGVFSPRVCSEGRAGLCLHLVRSLVWSLYYPKKGFLPGFLVPARFNPKHPAFAEQVLSLGDFQTCPHHDFTRSREGSRQPQNEQPGSQKVVTFLMEALQVNLFLGFM